MNIENVIHISIFLMAIGIGCFATMVFFIQYVPAISPIIGILIWGIIFKMFVKYLL